MRLINLDEKIFVPIIDEQIGASYEVQMTVAEVFDRFFEGNVPTIIDAIPVKWILQQPSYQTIAVRALVGKWNEEKEDIS